mgnify:CR=1 FL=1
MFITTFTDPQGVEHEDAVFEVSVANYSTYTHSNYDFRISQGDDDANKVEDESTQANLSYQMYFWTSQEARDAGMLPYYLANTDPLGEHFHVSEDFLTGPDYVGLSVAEKAEKHCKEVVLSITE